MHLFLPIILCCSALKIYLLRSILSSITRIVIILCYLYTSLHNSLLHVADCLRKIVLLECIYEWYQNNVVFNHTMTVLLEYINHLLEFSISALILLLMYFTYFLLCWHYA